MGILHHDHILKLHAAVISAQLTGSRSALLAGIDGHFVAGLPHATNPSDQILEDLDAMNRTGKLADGSIPLATWLANAVGRTRGRREEAIFAEALERVRAVIPTTATPVGAPSTMPTRETCEGRSVKPEGSQIKALRVALVEAYPALEEFRLMVREELNRSLDAVALGSNLNIIVAKVIEEAEAKGWLSALVDGARRGNPGNAALAEVARGILASEVLEASTGSLERIVRARSPFVSLQELLDFLERTKRQVCRVETRGREAVGTAFLVGPDVILTNHHVVSGSLGTGSPDLQVRFDYLTGRSGTLPMVGRVYELADEWLISAASWSPVDFAASTDTPDEGELDFALVRLREPASEEQVEGAARGWVEIPPSPARAQPDDIVAVIQHPNGDPLRIAIDTVLSVNANATRFTYRATTLGGASGSPCFSLTRQFVGLHHGGVDGKYNQGIPATALRAWFEKEGLDRFLGGKSSGRGGSGGGHGGRGAGAPRTTTSMAPSEEQAAKAAQVSTAGQPEPPPVAGGSPVFNFHISNSTIGAIGGGNGVDVTGTVAMAASPASVAGVPPSPGGSGRTAASAPSMSAAPPAPMSTPAKAPAAKARELASVYRSYGDEDLPFAQKLFEALEAAGVPVFFRHEHAVPGAKVHRSARKSIREYDHVILLCSEHSLPAPSVASELDEMLAREFDDGASERIIPVFLDDFVFQGWTPRQPDIRRTVLDRVPLDMKGTDGDHAKFEKSLKRLLGALKG